MGEIADLYMTMSAVHRTTFGGARLFASTFTRMIPRAAA